MTVDIEKAFYSINPYFLIKVMEKYRFEKGFCQVDYNITTKLRIMYHKRRNYNKLL